MAVPKLPSSYKKVTPEVSSDGEFDLSSAKKIGKAEGGSSSDVDPSTFEKVLNVLDIPGSIVRTGVEAAISPERDVLSSVGSQISKTFENPTTAPASAPSGYDIAETAGQELLGKSADREKTLAGEIGQHALGFGIEMVTDPTGLLFSTSGRVAKVLRKPLINMAEKQAANSVAKYVTKAGIKEGKDAKVLGTRLVEEDLQGLLKSPEKLYDKIAGKSRIQKINPESLDTLIIKRGPKEKGLIGEVADSVDDVIKKTQDYYGIKPIKNSDIMAQTIGENVKTALSKTSGETPDMGVVQKTLDKVLKPFETVSADAGYLGAGMTVKKSKTLNLEELQQLRKNIGKQVADRKFYATPDVAIAQETEVLKQLYRELGTTIKGQLEGKRVIIGNKTLDAGQFYEAQNNRLKHLLNMESLLEYAPTEALKSPDAAATLASMMAKGTTWGATAAAGSLFGLPISPGTSALLGFSAGAGNVAQEAIRRNAPEYLSDIFKQAAKVAPYGVQGLERGAIQTMRDGEFSPESSMGRSPQGGYDFNVGSPAFQGVLSSPQAAPINPRELIHYRIPRSTQGILENKEKVLAKLVQNGVPPEMIDTITQALNEDEEAVSNIAPLLMEQFPTIFEKSKYKVFDGKFIDPNDKARAADDISKRDDLNSIQRAKMISKINKTGEVPEGLA
jgi:hypothetical protein